MSDALERDDELRARLRASDPATSLPPAAPDRVARLLEETMSDDATTETRPTGTRGRGPLTWLVAAAAAAVIGGAGLVVVLQDDDPVGTAAPEPSASAEATVTELSAPDAGAAARCRIPDSASLAALPVAFDATVQSIEGDVVTLEPTHWYAGDPTDLVTVDAPSDALQQLLLAVDFEEGGRYLVAATADGQVVVCGFSAPYTTQLAGVYDEAFGG